MADVTLTAELRAKIDDLEKNIKIAVKTVKDASQQIDVDAGKAAKAIKGINPASNSAAFALTNLGRVAQDAPFGFIGIQNNINPLLESFQRLKQETGSTGGALKALASSLMGAGGLGLAVSLITAGLTLFTMWQQKAAHAVKEAKKETDGFVESLSAMQSAQLKGQQTGAQELVRLQILYNATQNVTLSQKDRNAAYDELASKYPKYFTNANRENTILGKNTLAYDNLKASILAMAQAKAYENRIGDESNKLYEDSARLVDLVAARSKARAEVARLQGSDAYVLSKPNTSFKAKTVDELRAENIAKVTERINTIEGFINRKLEEQSKRRKIISDLVDAASVSEQAAGFKTSSELDDKLTKAKAVKKVYEELYALSSTGSDVVVTQSNVNTNGLDSPQAMQAAIDKLQEYINLRATSLSQQSEKDKYDKREKENLQAITNVIGGGLMDAFQSAISGTQSFVASMGQFLTQLISKLVAAALAAAALSALLSFTGLGAFLGISSSSSSFSGLFTSLSGLPKMATGGIVTSPTIAMIGEGREPEAVIPLSKLGDMTGGGNNSGSNNWETRTILRGDKLLIQQRRAEESKSRRQ